VEHLLLPELELDAGWLAPEHAAYLREWLTSARDDAEHGDVAASVCLQGAFAELVTAGHLETDWIGVFDEWLTDEAGDPLAYSESFGKRLYKFTGQWKQSTVSAIHTRWWIERIAGDVDHEHYAQLILRKQKAGWIFDHDVSPTIERHRMKSELAQSMAQGIEILDAAGALETRRADLESTLASFPQTGYVSAEYFRLKALDRLGAVQHMPADTGDAIARCLLDAGACDFSLVSKTDAYMGTAKRTARDKMLPSPLSTCQAEEIASAIPDGEQAQAVTTSAANYGKALLAQPMNIPAFQMRDVPIAFGADKTPIEAICASALIQRYGGAA
jgi:hypothetical protein